MRHPPGRLRGYHRGPSDRGPYCDTSPSGEPVTYGDACTPTCPAVTSGTQRRYIGRRGAYPSLVKIGLCLSRVTMAFTKRPGPHGDHTRRRAHVDARPALATVTGRRPFLCQAVPHGLSMVTLIRGRRHHVGRTVPALGLLPPAFAHGHGKASARVCSQTPRLRRERNRSCGMTYTRYQRPSIVSAIALVGGCVRTQNRWWSRGHWSGILLLYIEVRGGGDDGLPVLPEGRNTGVGTDDGVGLIGCSAAGPASAPSTSGAARPSTACRCPLTSRCSSCSGACATN